MVAQQVFSHGPWHTVRTDLKALMFTNAPIFLREYTSPAARRTEEEGKLERAVI